MTSGAQTWLDLASVLPPDELVAVGDALYRAATSTPTARRIASSEPTASAASSSRAALAPLLTPLAASRPESLPATG